jgi:xanthine phosphoribosyltransferase
MIAQLLRERIQRDGKHLGSGILKVDSFINHQLDSTLMKGCGEEFARRFSDAKATKIFTAETSGIAPALSTAIALGLPMLFARKHQPLTMAANPYRQIADSHTHSRQIELIVSPEYLLSSDRVLIIDDFLATAKTILALTRLVDQSGAQLVGIGAVIEKAFEGGRRALEPLNVPIESLAVIERCVGDQIIFAEEREAMPRGVRV